MSTCTYPASSILPRATRSLLRATWRKCGNGTSTSWSGFACDETLVVAQFVFGGILDRHPALHLHIPHAGGNAPWLKGRFEMALHKRPWAKGLLDRSLEEVWRQMSFDCLIKPGPNMEFLVKAEGPDRILLGTNFAGWDQDDTIVASVEALPIPAEDRERILAGNARRLFGVRA